jgi:hypothetical protein
MEERVMEASAQLNAGFFGGLPVLGRRGIHNSIYSQYATALKVAPLGSNRTPSSSRLKATEHNWVISETQKPPITLNDNAKRIIGDNGLRRFKEFQSYQEGWEFGQGKRLSLYSVRTFEWVLMRLPELAVQEPSLFLTRNGNLQLGFEDAQGSTIEIEFFPNRVEYYMEASDEEGSIPAREINDFINRIRAIIS